ncbi:dolichyl-phosphate beta-glucosyltransferase [Pseudoclavibacter endophyticus]|uniref:ABC transporter permease n=1 Tax=Pseudoclavibacter endophyticus TaxID=1778590 RepID=A0A6H9WPP7_9MICO|nr:ABC transporter permease [Pseudoclavibacter endophyticus]KAB1648081.1 ABC transporter permease [Pseudoclavibacter endophyticus]GGA69530.1 dolichyl-phosphate beta-glucosyltransferase [Pseudoclavibacter endophyticus]
MTATESTTAPSAPPQPSERPSIGVWFWQGGTIIALLMLIIVFGAMRPDAFLSVGNIRNILEQVAILTIIAAAQTVVMVVGDIDLSVGTNATLSGATAAVLMTTATPTSVAIIAGLAVGTLVGLINGVLVAYMKLSAIVATLATMTTVGGLAFIVTGGTTLYGMPDDFLWIGQGRPLGLPTPVVFAVVVAVLAWVVLRFTTQGRRWYAIGGSAEVARLSGIDVRLGRCLAFTVAGMLSSVGGIILVSRLGSASATSANNYMMFAVAAVFLGMTILRSGQANIGGTLVGVGIIGVMSNGLNILGVNTYVQEVLTGIIIIAAVTMSAVKSRQH